MAIAYYMPRTPWIRMCASKLLDLRPDVQADILMVMATILWNEVRDQHPQEVAANEARSWSVKTTRPNCK